ncbi:MAG: alpha/beta hydrolase, partial [Lentisphaeraceae bacterium]|nr:alpha/beta hydrolase [Lentisphaeraceae bacterium]
ISYRHHRGGETCVVFLSGFHSHMNGLKAHCVFNYSVKNGHSALCLDYSGHGSSSGRFEEGNVSIWLSDVLAVLSELKLSKVILCGSSMGAWISLLAARQLEGRVSGVVTIAGAFDMTERFIWQRCTDEMKNTLENKGSFSYESNYEDDPYIISKQLIEDGRQHLILHKKISLSCPVILIHGTKDEDIPWQTSADAMSALDCPMASIELIKGAAHRCSDKEHLKIILQKLEILLNL